MASVAHCSRRLLLARSSTGLVQILPVRPRAAAAAGLAAARAAPSHNSSPAAASTSSASAPFSTSAAAQAKAVQHVRAGKQTQVSRKKKKFPPRGKPVAPGERKAYRKRIVLSNNNALAVPGLEELAQPDATAANAGRIMALPDAVVDQLRAIEAFKPTQNFSLFRRPSLLVRSETAALAARMQREVAQDKKTLRVVIDGERLAGKSTMLQQAMAHGFLNEFLVIHVPEGEFLSLSLSLFLSKKKKDEKKARQTLFVRLTPSQASN